MEPFTTKYIHFHLFHFHYKNLIDEQLKR